MQKNHFFWGPPVKCPKHGEEMDSRQNMPRPIRDDRGNCFSKIASKQGGEMGFSRKKCAWETACLKKNPKKTPCYKEKGLGEQRERWAKYGCCFSCLEVRGGCLSSKLMKAARCEFLAIENRDKNGQKRSPIPATDVCRDASSSMKHH